MKKAIIGRYYKTLEDAQKAQDKDKKKVILEVSGHYFLVNKKQADKI